MTEPERLKLEMEMQAEDIRELARQVRDLKRLVEYGFIAVAMCLVVIAT